MTTHEVPISVPEPARVEGDGGFPVACQLTACTAIEDACGVAVTDEVRALRRLICCGEWIESHALHIYLLNAPDFLGYQGDNQLAHDHPDVVSRGLRIRTAGSRLMEVVGGRCACPVNLRVGGFYRAPDAADLAALRPLLEQARGDAEDTVAWVADFDLPDCERDYEFVALRHRTDYPLTDGRIVSSAGLDIAPADYDGHFAEFKFERSTALHSKLDGRTYRTGPLARYSLNFDRLAADVKVAAHKAGLGDVCANPFRGIVVRAVELLYACDEALRLIEGYQPPDPPAVDVSPRAATGYGCVEAPRGLLYQRCRVTADGVLADATIVPSASPHQRLRRTSPTCG